MIIESVVHFQYKRGRSSRLETRKLRTHMYEHIVRVLINNQHYLYQPHLLIQQRDGVGVGIPLEIEFLRARLAQYHSVLARSRHMLDRSQLVDGRVDGSTEIGSAVRGGHCRRVSRRLSWWSQRLGGSVLESGLILLVVAEDGDRCCVVLQQTLTSLSGRRWTRNGERALPSARPITAQIDDVFYIPHQHCTVTVKLVREQPCTVRTMPHM